VNRFTENQTKLEFNVPPTFSTIEAERQHRKERLLRIARLWQAGLFRGRGRAHHGPGPELLDHFWVNPFGMNFPPHPSLRFDSRQPRGSGRRSKRPVNRAAFVIHAAVHAARPDVIAAAHAHSVYGKAFSSLGRNSTRSPRRLLLLRGSRSRHRWCGRIVLDEESGRILAKGLGDKKAAIHQNHGLFTVGQSVDRSAWWFITMERTCQAQLCRGGRHTILRTPTTRATPVSRLVSLAGWFSFQPLWDDIVKTDPELLTKYRRVRAAQQNRTRLRLWGHALLATLRANGLTTCFANPGTSEMHFVRRTRRRPEVRAILCLFEGVATGAADGYARVTRQPAATLFAPGTGTRQRLGESAQRASANVPVLNIVGDHATYHATYDAPLQSNIEALASTLEGWHRRTTNLTTSRLIRARPLAPRTDLPVRSRR